VLRLQIKPAERVQLLGGVLFEKARGLFSRNLVELDRLEKGFGSEKIAGREAVRFAQLGQARAPALGRGDRLERGHLWSGRARKS
jgi:hypothetical protein